MINRSLRSNFSRSDQFPRFAGLPLSGDLTGNQASAELLNLSLSRSRRSSNEPSLDGIITVQVNRLFNRLPQVKLRFGQVPKEFVKGIGEKRLQLAST